MIYSRNFVKQWATIFNGDSTITSGGITWMILRSGNDDASNVEDQTVDGADDPTVHASRAGEIESMHRGEQ